MTSVRPSGKNGKRVVLALLIAGLIGGLVLSHYMPRRNPRLAEPGSPYYSPPDDNDLKPLMAPKGNESSAPPLK
jgi:hypothetical protein